MPTRSAGAVKNLVATCVARLPPCFWLTFHHRVLGLVPRCVADMQDLDHPARFQNAENHAIDVRFASIKEVAQPCVFRGDGTPIGIPLQGVDRALKSAKPSKGSIGMFRMDRVEYGCEVTLRTGH